MPESLVTLLRKRGTLVSPSLIRAFQEVPRGVFVPTDLRELAEADIALPIGFGQTLSQPSTVAIMLELLDVEPGQTVLDVGSGSGWTTALLGALVGSRGQVIALERIPELAEQTKKNVSQFGLQETGIVQCFCKNGNVGAKEWAPFDRILVSAAGAAIPDALKKQLVVGGKLVMPVRDCLILLEKRGENDFYQEERPGFVFVPFIEE